MKFRHRWKLKGEKERVEGWMGSDHIKGTTRNNTNFFYGRKEILVWLELLATDLRGEDSIDLLRGYLFFFSLAKNSRKEVFQPTRRYDVAIRHLFTSRFEKYYPNGSSIVYAIFRSSGKLFSIEDCRFE